MKNIFTYISALFFIFSAIGINVYLDQGRHHIALTDRDHVFNSADGITYQRNLANQPFDCCHNERKDVEGRHSNRVAVVNSSRSFNRDILMVCFVPSFNHTAGINFLIEKPIPGLFTSPLIKESIHIRNCVWLI